MELDAFKDLSAAELALGYSWSEDTGAYTCIFCGEGFENGLIYQEEGQLMTAEKAAARHVEEVHGSSFEALLELNKTISGISPVQKTLLSALYEGQDNKEICKRLNISVSTVRTHKFNLQRMKRQAKIFLALMDIVENSRQVDRKPKKSSIEKSEPDSKKNALDENPELPVNDKGEEVTKKLFSLNLLHPFFTQYRMK